MSEYSLTEDNLNNIISNAINNALPSFEKTIRDQVIKEIKHNHMENEKNMIHNTTEKQLREMKISELKTWIINHDGKYKSKSTKHILLEQALVLLNKKPSLETPIIKNIGNNSENCIFDEKKIVHKNNNPEMPDKTSTTIVTSSECNNFVIKQIDHKDDNSETAEKICTTIDTSSECNNFCTLENLLSAEKNGNLASLLTWTPSDVNLKMRRILSSWLIKVSDMFKLKPDTYFHTIAILDRYLECTDPNRNILQKYGSASLMIAAKKNEIYSPEMNDMIYVADKAFTKNEIIDAEMDLFKKMGYNVEIPNVIEYIRYMSIHSDATSIEHNIVKELCLCYVSFGKHQFLPSALVTSAHRIACLFTKKSPYNPFSIPDDVIDIIMARIVTVFKKFSKLYMIDHVKKVFRKFKIDWDQFNQMMMDLPSKSTYIISPEYITEHYVCNRKTTPIIKQNVIKKHVCLGEGTYGRVYKISIDTIYHAIKKIRASYEDGLSTSYIREISILQNLSHKNIIRITHVIDDTRSFIIPIMECDLKKYLDYHKPHDAGFQNACANQLLDGLIYMHACGVLHRDIKVQNILVNGEWPDMVMKYCDFGLARGCNITIHDVSYTHSVCTLWYRPPELLLGSTTYNSKLDVWSLVCVLYEIIKHTALFPGEFEIDQMYKIFRILGTPTEDIWHGVSALSEYKVTFPKWDKQTIKFPITADPHVILVIENGLIMNPNMRPSAVELKQLMK